MDLNEGSKDSGPAFHQLPAKSKEQREQMDVALALVEVPQTEVSGNCRQGVTTEPEAAKDLSGRGDLALKADSGAHQSKIRMEGSKLPSADDPPAKRMKLDTLEESQGSKNTVVSETAALPSDLKPPQTHTREVQDDVKEAAEGCQNQAKKIKAGAALPCPSCNFMAKNKIALKIHTKQHHFNDIYLVCDICNVTSPSEESHRKHLSSVLHKKLTKSTRESTGTKEGFNCRLCGQLLPSRYDLDKHIKENHSKRSKAHVCPQCKYKAESGASLQAHLKHKHVQKERLSCDLCGFRCYDENLLKTHCRGKTHLRRKNLAARGGYIHLLSKKRLPAESSARGKVERAKCINDDSPSLRKKPKNLGRAKNKSTTQKNNRSAKCLEKSKNPGNDHCEEAPSSKADERVQLNDSRAGKASPQRTSRRVKEPTDLLQERVGKQRLKRSDEGSVSSLRPRSGRCTDNTERVRHTRSEGRLSQEEVGNQRAPRNLRGRGSLLTMDNSRGRGRHPGRSTVIPDVQCGRGKLPGKKNQGVKSKCKISGATDQLDGKPENQGERGDADSSNRTEANLENEKSSKTSCQSGNEEGETAMQVVLQEPTLVKNSTDNVSQVQNLVSPTTNPADNKTPNLENPESKLSPADRKALRTCSYCGHVFQNRKGLEVHIKRRHTKEMDFHCQPCGYACVTKGDFEKHCQSNRHQLNFSQIDCQLCAFVTLDEGALKEHMSQEHKMAFYCSACRLHFASEEDLVDHEGSEQHTRRVLPQQKEKALEQIENQQPREENQSKITSDGNGEPTVPRSGLSLKDPQKPSIARVIAGNILRRSTHSRLQLQCKSCFYKARSATVLLKHIRLRHAQEYRFLCKVCSLYTISREAMEKHIKRSRHIENAKKRNLGPSLEECVEEVSIGVQDVQKIIKTTGALGNVNSEIDKGCVQVLEPSKSKEEFVVTWEISEGDATNVENVQKDNDLPSAEGIKKERPKGNISRTCPHCGLLASSVTNLNIHIRRKHSHQYSYFCKACNYYTVTKGDMDRHCNTKKHKNRADVSKPVEICRKAAMPNNKDNPQMVGTDSPALPTADCVESNSSVSEPEIPEKEGQSGVLENCTHVNLESVLSVQNEQHMDEQKGTEAILEVEPNSTGQDGGSSSSKRLKGNHATTCAYCGFVAYSQATLELHVKRKHTKDFDYYCMACDYYAVTRREMMRHAFTEKHKLKSQSYLKLNQGKGQPAMRGSITATNASKDGNQKEGSEDYPLKVRRDEGEKASEITLEATQESALCTEPKRMPESNEVTNDYKETTAVFELTETEEKSFQNEIANQGGLIETVPTVHNSENFAEVGSGMLDVNTACPGAKSPSVDLNSVSVKSAELENSQDQVADAPTEGNSSRCINIVTMQKTSMASNDADLNVEASQTGEVDDLQGSHQGDERPKDDKPTKEIANLGSRPYEIVDPNGNMSNCSGLAEDVSVQVEPSALPGGSEGNTTEQNADGHPNVTGLQQPEKNSDHVQVNLVQQVEGSYEDTAATATTEVPGQNHADREQVIGADEAQDKGDAALREKTRDVKNANEVRQDLEGDTVEAAESSSDDLRKMEFQGKGLQKYFEFDSSIVRLKNKSWTEKPECTDNSEGSRGVDGISHSEWAVAVYKTDPSQAARKRKAKGALLQDPKRIRCEDCGFLADGVNGLNVHIAMKHPSAEKHFHCLLCGKSFYSVSNLHQHLASVGHQRMEQESVEELPEGGATFKCVKCSTPFDSEQDLFVHIKQKHEEMLREVNKYIVEDTEQINCERQENRGNVCKYCGKVCKSSNSLAFLAHIRTHTGSKPFRCTLCNFATAQLGDARNHVKRHLGVREYKCHICGWAFVMKKHLSTHLLGKHGIGTPKERKFVCEICDRTFTEKWALTNHKKLHMGQKPFKCPWLTCHYSFLTASAMRDHFRTHTGEKSFLCDLCRFAGGTRHALTKHRRQHTGEKPFKCDQCNFASTTQSHLTRHRRVHTGEKPYKCPWCDYRSNCAENIRKHILHTGKHEGVLMYNCPKCEYGTNIPLEFRNHLKELHPDIENPDLAYLHAGIVSKAYECRLKGQGAQFVETAVPFNTPPSSDSTEVVGNSVNGCVQQQEQTESIGQVIIIQGYQDSYGEAVPIDASVEATAAATLQTLAMAGQMAQVAEVVHITEDGQLIATAQTASHEGGMMPGQILSRHLASGTTQVVVVESPVGGGDAGEAAVTMETLGDPSHVIEQVVTQEESAGQPADTPTALDALLCAITELGAVEVRSSEQGGHEPVQEEPGVAESALEEVTSVPSEPQSSHKEQVADEVTRAAGVAPEVEQPAAVTTAQTVPQASFSDMVQEVLQFTMCDIRTASHIVKDGITQVIVTKEGAAHMVEGASQIIMQEGEEQTITTSGHPVQLIDSDGSISQLIVTEEIAQAMVQEATAHMSDQATHVIVTELPHGMVNSVDSGAVTEVYPHGVMELMAEGVSTLGHPVTTIALTECYTEGRSEIVMTELPAGEEQEMEVGGNQEA
ncbi:zinc finger protein 407 isoform X1 [Pristis pectinata]|uniref:zinc finger protein 407 isoform X1 n=1 Tax=Pristis pectinata TaxID=685728 RepID=UPI00223DF1C8|nr:zinc finger protein 407 isoform X1 [Pristis pectinata]XP_051879923.1 zinc finger protein 407 isoform X1 [Pristis pectinata]XP_051879925.1 zinc finger protein 407 isoform X1 [Pristis pectinata]